jgi:hypothetical protein
MLILDQPIRSQISDLSEACGRYWELRGIAEAHRNEMQLELEHHLLQAAMDGKSTETVVGPNPAAFAEAWAREMHPHVLRGGVLLLPGLTYALSVMSTTALFQQLLAHTSSFTFSRLRDPVQPSADWHTPAAGPVVSPPRYVLAHLSGWLCSHPVSGLLYPREYRCAALHVGFGAQASPMDLAHCPAAFDPTDVVGETLAFCSACSGRRDSRDLRHAPIEAQSGASKYRGGDRPCFSPGVVCL